MEPLANLNGEIMPLSEAKVPALDRGFLFGDAVYEALRVYAGVPLLLDEHMVRLERSLDGLAIRGVDIERLKRRMMETIRRGSFAEASVYIEITRGVATRTHYFPKDTPPLEFLFVNELRDPYAAARENGMAVVTHADLRWQRCDLKTVNLLGNVLAAQAAKAAGAMEALLLRPDGTINEGAHTSVFLVKSGTLHTAPMSPAVLPGITRDAVVRIAREQGIPLTERHVTINEALNADELFVSGTTSELLPVVKIDGRQVADGRPGPVTRRVQAAYGALVQDYVRKFSRGS